MDHTVPTAADVSSALKLMTTAQLQQLAELSGVPFHTLLKIRGGETKNPRVDSVAKFWPHLGAVAQKVVA
jgi:hypothetical protein